MQCEVSSVYKIRLKTLIILVVSSCVTPSTAPLSLQQMSATAIQMEVFFSPGEECQEHIVDAINRSKNTLDIAIYSITDKDIADALYEAKNRGVRLRLLVDFVQASILASKARVILEHGINLRVHSTNGFMHNKYAIFDGQKVLSGSYNWTSRAVDVNSENCVFISDVGTAQAFKNNFDTLWIKNTEEKSRRRMADMKKLKLKHKSLPTTCIDEQLSLF